MKRAAIIGAGPAGLTAALELLERTDVVPVVFEASDALGGLSRTVVHAGNRIDIGGHRFFSKSDRVMDWWLRILPQQGTPAPDPATTDAVMLVRSRLSRIFYLRRFFDYPVTLSLQTVRNLGPARMLRIGLGYARARLLPVRPERNLEDFFINRFGRELYGTFFRDYTEKVWGVPCRAIRPEWGAQRIKGLSITGALIHAARGIFGRDGSVRQKGVETSLIERFLYPKFGPGQMWEEVARRVVERGGEIHHGSRCVGMDVADGRVTAVRIEDAASGRTTAHAADYVISTMPVLDLVAGLGGGVPANVREVAAGLRYRDFITVGLLLDRLLIRNETSRPTPDNLIPDNWIYIQEPDVRLGRLQVFNNWSPYLVADPTKAWLGLEYFCNEGDDLWSMDDASFADFAVAELAQIGVIDPADVRDRVVIRMPKTYPAYFGTYDRFGEIRAHLDTLVNLFPIGRNGMHRYNNQDHSMLTAMAAVDAIASGATDKTAIWDVNVEGEYHEEKRS
ncbi:MAG: NAD(P)/FAD-dependent oxidoreductase [Candidatus Latescibacteria bacterium]|nr:NAD(P)/FAD-dependent oxidoreductase [Candidatus Latescibacterota bacterium]